MGPKGVIDTQIAVYRRLKKKFPAYHESDILNSLIMSRLNAPLSSTNKSAELSHYESLLNNSDKTLKDVIWEIVEYEYILSRGDQLHLDLLDMNAQVSGVIGELRSYIDERVEKIA